MIGIFSKFANIFNKMSTPPNSSIIGFIKKHHVLTLATSFNEETWCANCFYTYLDDDNCLIISSSLNTKHIQQVSHNIFVAGTIAVETSVVGKIQGVQFQGVINQLQDERLEKARQAYTKRFPMARLMDNPLWAIDLTFIKLTDNRLRFGEKIIWKIDSI